MNDFDNIDFTTGGLRVTFVDAEPLKNGDSFNIDSTVTWSPASGASIDALVIYGEYRVRDWRFLWLRHRTVTRLIDYIVEQP